VRTPPLAITGPISDDPPVRHLRALGTAVAIATASALLGAAPAEAGKTESGVLMCGSTQYTVTGFGRGQVLFVTGTTQRFIVTFAQFTTGEVVFEARGQRAKNDIVTCTTTSPITDRSFIFRGFFTPRAP